MHVYCASHQSEHLREVSAGLPTVRDHGKALQEHLDSFAALFVRLRRADGSTFDVWGIGVLIDCLAADTIVIKFQKLIPMMLSVIESALTAVLTTWLSKRWRFSAIWLRAHVQY